MIHAPLSYEHITADEFRRLRQRLAEIGYAPEPVASCLQLSDVSALYPLDYWRLPRFVELLEVRPSALATAIRLLLLGLPSRLSEVQDALGKLALSFCLDCGLLAKDGSTIHAILSIVPFEGLLVATDKLFMNVDPDFVEPGLSSDSFVWRLDRTTLLMSQSRRRSEYQDALELGSGSGVLSLLTAKNAKKVTGVDINPRVINVAKFNALLNQVENVSFVQGDLYQPVNGMRFDFIFSNPPSAPGLVRAWNREAGPTGREMVEDMLRGIDEHLAAGGMFQTTMHFGYRDKSDIDEWAMSLLKMGNYTITVDMLGDEEDAASFALREAYQKAGPRDYGLFERTYRKYKEGFKNIGFETIAFGLLTVACKDKVFK